MKYDTLKPVQITKENILATIGPLFSRLTNVTLHSAPVIDLDLDECKEVYQREALKWLQNLKHFQSIRKLTLQSLSYGSSCRYIEEILSALPKLEALTSVSSRSRIHKLK